MNAQVQELPSELSDEDRELFTPALQQFEAARQAMEQAQANLGQTQMNTARASGAVAYLFERLKIKYKLADGDDIDANGRIIRR